MLRQSHEYLVGVINIIFTYCHNHSQSMTFLEGVGMFRVKCYIIHAAASLVIMNVHCTKFLFILASWISTLTMISSRWWSQAFFSFYPYPGKWSKLTNIFQTSWNHQLVILNVGSFQTSFEQRFICIKRGMVGSPWSIQLHFARWIHCNIPYVDIHGASYRMCRTHTIIVYA